MRNISDTLARLSAMRGMGALHDEAWGPSRLTPLTGFGSNPGGLKAHVYVPADLPMSAPLVVVLHGCTQTAGGYDTGSGWSQMADRHGFALLFPEQQQANNPNLCFNWFSPQDIRRDQGEALSIRQMIEAVAVRHSIDAARIFVTGLSAGGAMTSVLLATYPEIFAGGAVIAGLPYDCAATIPQAFDRMRGHGLPASRALSASVQRASSHSGPWPTLSVWHGSADATVSQKNAQAIIDQWSPLHGVALEPDYSEEATGHRRRVWRDRSGREAIEEYIVAGMGHGTPLGKAGDEPCGKPGPFMLPAGISSTYQICRYWGLTNTNPFTASVMASPASQAAVHPAALEQPDLQPLHNDHGRPAHAASARGVRKVIQDALRAAGLVK